MVIISGVIVYAIIDIRSSPDFPLDDAVETFVRRQDAERFVEEVRSDDPELASKPPDRGARARGGRVELAVPFSSARQGVVPRRHIEGLVRKHSQ